MLELVAFVETNLGKLAILPVIWDSPAMNVQGMKQDVNIGFLCGGKWEDALKVLGPSNGIEYMESLGEVVLRKEIVSAIWHLLPPKSSWSAAHVQGRTCILKVVINKFKNTKLSPLYSVCIVGLYGMGGIGKTTFCKALCDELHLKFKGRVCNAKLDSKTSIELHREVLQKLTHINHNNLMFKDE